MVFNGGISVSEGLAYGKAHLYIHCKNQIEHVLVNKDDVASEIGIFSSTLESLIEKDKALVYKNEQEKSLIDMNIAMLSDPELKAKVEMMISAKLYNAPWAVSVVLDEYIDAMKAIKDEYMSERVSDFEDVKYKLVSTLLDKCNDISLSEPSILVADYLLPSELLSLDKAKLKAIVVEKGGATSHIAILSKSLGIPAILAMKNITKEVKNSEWIIVDGIDGNVISNPNAEQIAYCNERIETKEEEKAELLRSSGLPAVTTDGHRIHLFYNIEGLDGLDGVLKSGAEGIGLFRTEFLFLQKDLFPNEQERAEIYKKVACEMKNVGPVVVRTMDVGGDKFSDSLGIQEDNPFLGNRSIRYAMNHKELFRDQLISILKASIYNDIEIMFPFISGPDELADVLEFFENTKNECREKNIPFDEKMKVGTMIEVPSAAITSDIIADMVDFMSIGTNDLIQYTIAVDRGNEKVAKFYSALHPAVLRLIKSVVENGKKKNKPVSICGEMAGSLEYMPILIGLGMERLSMVAPAVLKARERIRALSYEDCKNLVDRLLEKKDEKSIKKELEEFNNGKT